MSSQYTNHAGFEFSTCKISLWPHNYIVLSQFFFLNKTMLHVQYFKNDSVLKGFGFNVDLIFLLTF